MTLREVDEKLIKNSEARKSRQKVSSVLLAADSKYRREMVAFELLQAQLSREAVDVSATDLQRQALIERS